jgi:LysM domain
MKKYFIICFYIFSLSVVSLLPLAVYAQEEEVGSEESFDEDADDFADEDASADDEDADLEDEIEEDNAQAEKEPEPVVAEPTPEVAPEPAPEAPTEVTAEEPPTEEPPPTQELLVEPEQEMVIAEPVNDEPDLNYEAKLHDIFINFHNSKTSEAEWQSLTGTRPSERYTIQSGDNLWNISKTLFGDGNYWPKVWSLNSNIKNPHLVSPNNSIRFLLGDESSPPAFAVTENSTEETNVNVNVSTQDTSVTTSETSTALDSSNNTANEPAPDIPAPLKVSRPVVKNLPPSLPAWQDVSSKGDYDDLGIEYAKRKIIDIEDTVPLTSYISENIPESSGSISEIEAGHNIASAYQYVYVSMKKGVGQVGDTYLVVANRGEVQSVHSSIKGFLGYSIDVQGEVQLVERAAGIDENTNGEVYRALVLKIINPVSVGSILTTGSLEKIKITEEGERSQVVAQIIGGSFFNRRQIYGSESIAYLNRGSADGISEGQILPIRANRALRNANTIVKSNVRPIGWLRVVKVTPHFATAIVLRAWSDVLTGDLTGSGDILPISGLGQPISTGEDTTTTTSLQSELDNEDDFNADKPAQKADEEVLEEKIDDDSEFENSEFEE